MDDAQARLQTYLTRNRGDRVAAAIERWCVQTERLLAFERLPNVRARRVYYERFVESPGEELDRLMTFLGVALVPGLSLAAFEAKHDRGPADMKIRSTRSVDPGRVGKGRDIDLQAVPADLRARLTRLLAILGYAPVEG
jgi:hypothetical protein